MDIPDKYIRTAADRKAIEDGAYWDQAEADRVVRFAETYVAPQFVRGEFRLLDWQREWLEQLYGWRLADGRRRWRKALLTVAKKAGKTLLTAIVCLYESLAAGVPSPLVVSASTTKENARQVYDEIKHSLQRSERLSKLSKIVPSQKIIRFPKRNGEVRSISNDSGNAEGLNLSCCVCDEVHKWASNRGEQLWRTLEYSTIARPDGLLVVISTAGSDRGHFFYDLYTKARNVLDGSDLDTSFFGTVYETPFEADVDDPANWYLSNPSLGTAFSEADFRRDLEAAKKNTADFLSFKRYRLNMWVAPEDAWIDLLKWDANKRAVSEDDLRNAPCWVGVDASMTTDPTSVSAVWHLGGKRFFAKSWAWVCRAGVEKREATNLPRYQQYATNGVMTITEGDVIDDKAVKRFVLELGQRYQVKELLFDQFNSTVMATELMGEGFQVFRFPQNFRHYNAPCKEFEKAVGEGRFGHDGNPLLRWAVGNVRLDVDSYGNAKPSRAKSLDKIDPVVSCLMAFSRASEASADVAPRKSVYEGRGVLTL
ncbi:MAG: hypothetical protein K2X38_01550 [Gemmataceae bacterium]|nr:hypothetical protein [Gemmataceae bacterium]